jgi:hypothetical protein
MPQPAPVCPLQHARGCAEVTLPHSFVSCRRRRLNPLTPRGPVLTREPQDADLARGSHPPHRACGARARAWERRRLADAARHANGTDRVRDPHIADLDTAGLKRGGARPDLRALCGLAAHYAVLVGASLFFADVLSGCDKLPASRPRGKMHGNRYHGRRSGAIVRPHRSSIKSHFARHDTDLRNGGIAA